jgi:hypothetical protein
MAGEMGLEVPIAPASGLPSAKSTGGISRPARDMAWFTRWHEFSSRPASRIDRSASPFAGVAGHMTWPSFVAAARWTLIEGVATPLRRKPWKKFRR